MRRGYQERQAAAWRESTQRREPSISPPREALRDRHKPPGEKRVVLTCFIGMRPVRRITAPHLAAYAVRCGAQLIELSGPLGGPTPHWIKFRIRDFLEEGCRVLWLDADTLPMPWCPNLFDHYAPDGVRDLVMLDEDDAGVWRRNYSGMRDRVRRRARELGNQGWDFPQGDTAYWNTGVMLAEPTHTSKAVFTLSDPPHFNDSVHEQTLLNFYFRRHNARMVRLLPECNAMADRAPGCLYHAAGWQGGDKLAHLERAEQVARYAAAQFHDEPEPEPCAEPDPRFANIEAAA